jgi:hypothetical protein
MSWLIVKKLKGQKVKKEKRKKGKSADAQAKCQVSG